MRRTTPQQFQKLVELMENNPGVARGIGNYGETRRSRAELWDHFATDLNSIGPPIRNGREWNKVWLDYKLKLKKKVSTNRSETVATGGGPYAQRSLSALERSVDELLNLQEAANPTGQSFGTNNPGNNRGGTNNPGNNGGGPNNAGNNGVESDNTSESESEGEEDHRDLNITPSSSTPRPRMTLEDRENMRLKALEQQGEVQKTLCQGITKMTEKLDEMARYARKTYELKKDQVKLLKKKEERKKEESVERKRQHKEKMEIKIKELDLKALKYNIRK